MSSENLRSVLVTRFDAQFKAAYPTIPIKYPNQPFEQPLKAAWVDFRINEGKGNQANLGIVNVTDRNGGYVQVDVVVPKDSGTKAQNEMADFIGDIFKRQQYALTNGQVTMMVPEKMPEVEIGETSVKPVRIPFSKDVRS